MIGQPKRNPMAEKPRLDQTRLQNIAQAYWQSAALMAAVELDVFSAIAHGHDTIPMAAKAAGISERNAERLLTALSAMTLLTRDGERFANAPDVQRFLVKDGERYAGPWILFTKPRWAAYGELSQRLRATTENRLGAYESFTVDDARRYHAATYSIGMARCACSAAASISAATARCSISAAARRPTASWRPKPFPA